MTATATGKPRPDLLDRIDSDAADVARQVLAGQLEEGQGRARLAELVMQARVAEPVGFTYRGLSQQRRLDLIESLTAMLVMKVLDRGSSFDMGRIAEGSSLCGWARNLAVLAAAKDPVVRRRAMDQATHLAAPLIGDETPVDEVSYQYHVATAFGGATAEDMTLAGLDPEVTDDDVDDAHARLAFTDGVKKDRATATVIRRALHLPGVCVPSDAGEAAAVLEAVQADPGLAHRSLVQMAVQVIAEPPVVPAAGEAPVGELMESLWDDFAPEQLETLMVRPASLAHALVLDAVQPLPKPSRTVARAMARWVRQACAHPRWLSATEGLVVAFLATCTEALSERDHSSSEAARKQVVVEAREAAARFPVLAEQVARFPGAPLGGSAEEVGEVLRGRLEELLSADEDEVAARRLKHGSRQFRVVEGTGETGQVAA